VCKAYYIKLPPITNKIGINRLRIL